MEIKYLTPHLIDKVVSLNSPYGLCTRLAEVALRTRVDRTVGTELVYIMARWADRSGFLNFPVPGPDGTSAIRAYYDLDHWNPNTPYGASRLALAQFIRDYVEEAWK